MNSDHATSKNLHRAYVKCCEAQLKDWLSSEGHQASSEFCVAEKTAWMDHMRQKLPVQYGNIVRLEQMNF
jgi:hypothetical protein